jgi:uncharacterized YccA/Bax inhibitor family protein
MIIPLTTPVDTEPNNFLTIVVESLMFGISGLIMGSIINKYFILFSKIFLKKNKTLQMLFSLVQIAFSGFVLAFLYFYVSSYFVNHFQRTISGLAFPAIFYGVQSNIFSLWQ